MAALIIPVSVKKQSYPALATSYWQLLDLLMEIRDQIHSLPLIEPPRAPEVPSGVVPPRTGETITSQPSIGLVSLGPEPGMEPFRASKPTPARVFWEFNVFSFNGSAQFARNVGLNLRLEYCSLVRHVVIYDKRHDFAIKGEACQVYRAEEYCLYGRIPSRLWDTIFSCDTPQTLQIRPELLM
ncbi:hypothetical protein DL769_006183 [Monosporascus sp. CRB-8-3]|nr:hypothetical protein DL769_006183 [Monosporascus sp. CRB-8-3]